MNITGYALILYMATAKTKSENKHILMCTGAFKKNLELTATSHVSK
jgi:hypothetical protein